MCEMINSDRALRDSLTEMHVHGSAKQGSLTRQMRDGIGCGKTRTKKRRESHFEERDVGRGAQLACGGAPVRPGVLQTMSKTEEQDDRHNFEDPTHPLFNYEKLEKIGEGTYGVVRNRIRPRYLCH